MNLNGQITDLEHTVSSCFIRSENMNRSTRNVSATVGKEQKHSVGKESLLDDSWVYKCLSPGWSAQVHQAVTGSEVSGSVLFFFLLKKICEAELK